MEKLDWGISDPLLFHLWDLVFFGNLTDYLWSEIALLLEQSTSIFKREDDYHQYTHRVNRKQILTKKNSSLRNQIMERLSKKWYFGNFIKISFGLDLNKKMLIFGIENQLNLFENYFCLKNINVEEKRLVKFIYSEKTRKFDKISILFMALLIFKLLCFLIMCLNFGQL